jgi:hypothetical protein
LLKVSRLDAARKYQTFLKTLNNLLRPDFSNFEMISSSPASSQMPSHPVAIEKYLGILLPFNIFSVSIILSLIQAGKKLVHRKLTLPLRFNLPPGLYKRFQESNKVVLNAYYAVFKKWLSKLFFMVMLEI